MELISENAALASLQDVAFLHTMCAMCVLQFPAEGTGLLSPSVIVPQRGGGVAPALLMPLAAKCLWTGFNFT